MKLSLEQMYTVELYLQMKVHNEDGLFYLIFANKNLKPNFLA